jgi:uncharacterized protein YoaH (UPF0181 family)
MSDAEVHARLCARGVDSGEALDLVRDRDKGGYATERINQVLGGDE